MPLTGAWLEARRARDPSQAVLHEVDLRHSKREEVDASTDPPIWQAPAYEETAPAPPEIGLEWVTNPQDAPGVVLDYPSRDHSSSPGHQVSQSGTEGWNNTSLQFSDTEYVTDVTEGQPGSVSHIDEVALRRGLNADPQNNPPQSSYLGEGFRRGNYFQWVTRRKFSPPWRRHSFRVVLPQTAYVGGDAPPPDHGNQYTSPFSSMARNIRNINARPQLRRTPSPVDETVMTDGTETAYLSHVDDWVTG